MRRTASALLLSLFLGLAGQPAALAADSKPAALADVLTYVRLFGYREMLQIGMERQLSEVAKYYREQRPEVDAQTLAAIFGELRSELSSSLDESEREMALVFQRHFNAEDVAFLVGVGSDPRMRKVVRLQPAIAKDLEPINERLAEQMVARALPRIEERLRALPQGEKLPL